VPEACVDDDFDLLLRDGLVVWHYSFREYDFVSWGQRPG